ncbi:hypothetical protein V6N13_109382 [Hibiscus sabdariffa]|uniref:Uncharacterized protein n=1 Tax=Hibiscus sabdariffa TaxID=183260 RepID=A0ABR2FPD6_9ROSI
MTETSFMGACSFLPLSSRMDHGELTESDTTDPMTPGSIFLQISLNLNWFDFLAIKFGEFDHQHADVTDLQPRQVYTGLKVKSRR